MHLFIFFSIKDEFASISKDNKKRFRRKQQDMPEKSDQYKCYICQKILKRYFNLKKHLKTHSQAFLHCRFCSKRFTLNTQHLEKHEENCGIKYDEIPPKPLKKKPGQTIDGEKIICNICGAGYVHRYTFSLHLKKHGNPDLFKCDKCPKTYNFLSNMINHKKLHVFKCPICQKSCGSSSHLKRHVKNHKETGLYCRHCNKKLGPVKAYLKKHENKCKFRKFIDTLGQDEHVVEHILPDCNEIETLSTEIIIPTDDVKIESQNQIINDEDVKHETDELNDQVQVENPSPKKIICDICRSEFDRQGHLKKHLRLHHQSDLYKCNICFKQFDSANSLRLHMKVYNNHPELHETFKKKKEKKVKERIKKKKVERKIYVCNICKTVFKTKRHFDNHQVLHENPDIYKCNICDKRY